MISEVMMLKIQGINDILTHIHIEMTLQVIEMTLQVNRVIF